HLILVRRRSERELEAASVKRFEQLAHPRKRLYIFQVLVLVKFGPILLQRLAELAHLTRVEQIGNEQIATLPDLISHHVPFEVLPEMFERLDPTAGVNIVGV